jgi:uncharacterized protein YerC
MASVILDGQAADWANAAWTHRRLVANYARRSFRHLDAAEFWIDRTVDHFLDVVRRKWQPGEDLRLSLRLLISPIMRKARRELSCRRTKTSLARLVKDQQESLDATVDVRIAISRMDDLARRILTMLAEGYQWREVVNEVGYSVVTISKVRDELRHRLADYRPHLPPRRRGPGRPPRRFY